jgi:hypothetical protein
MKETGTSQFITCMGFGLFDTKTKSKMLLVWGGVEWRVKKKSLREKKDG